STLSNPRTGWGSCTETRRFPYRGNFHHFRHCSETFRRRIFRAVDPIHAFADWLCTRCAPAARTAAHPYMRASPFGPSAAVGLAQEDCYRSGWRKKLFSILRGEADDVFDIVGGAVGYVRAQVNRSHRDTFPVSYYCSETTDRLKR